MRQVAITDKKRKGKTKFSKQDKTKYNEQYFQMFGGEVEAVTLRCRNEMAKFCVNAIYTLTEYLWGYDHMEEMQGEGEY